MAVEIHSGGATVARDGSVTLTRTFRINTGNAAARPAWSVAGIGISKYDAHPDDATCLATDVSSSPVSGELGWFDVSYTYSNRPFDPGTTDSEASPGANDPTVQPNPTLRTPTIRISSNTRMVPWEKDAYDDDIANSAKQPYEGLEVELATQVISVSFNLAPTTDVSGKQQGYVNKVNDAAFTIIPAWGAYPNGTLRCNAWNATLQYEAGYGWYYSCEVELEWMDGGWQRDLLDQGTYTLKNDAGVYTQEKIINDKTGQPVDSPVKLNGFGEKLLPNANPGHTTVPHEAAPYYQVGGGTENVRVYRRFYPYRWVDFTNIFTAA